MEKNSIITDLVNDDIKSTNSDVQPNKVFKLSKDDLNTIVEQTGCSVETATEAYSTLGNTIDSILYILEGDEQYNKNEELYNQKRMLDLDDESKIHVENINKLRIIAAEKDAIFEALIHG